jgi:RNA polymerase sigma factor (sigma-70 family)
MAVSVDGVPVGIAGLEGVAELYAAQAARVRCLVGAGVRAPEPVIEDACQFAWSRLILHRARIRPETATAWVVRTAIHEALKLTRRGGRDLSLDALAEDAGELGEPSAVAAPVLLEELVEHRARLESIRMLPERQQRLVWLQGLGLSYSEMAGHTGDSRRTVERQLLRAKQTLARYAA